MPKPARIEMIFYAHPWSVHLVGEQILDANENSVLVEVATESNLEHVCGLKVDSPGVLPLLKTPTKIDLPAMATRFPLIDAPLLLASKQPLSRATVIHSLLSLESCSVNCDVVYLLAHINDAAAYRSIFPLVHRFGVLWDSADFPSEELAECVSVLRRSESLSPHRWRGFMVANHWLRKSADSEHNKQQLTAAMSAHAVS